MRQIQDHALLEKYIGQYQLQDIFSLELSECAFLLQYDQDELIIQAGDTCKNFLIHVEGNCMAYSITSSEKIHCECYYHGLSILGLVSALWNEPAINNIRTITPCIFIAIPVNPYRAFLQNDVKFLRYAEFWLANHIRKNASHFEPLQNRLAAFILDVQKNNVFQFNMTLCADLLETSYRHLLRTLQSFCNENILQKTSKASYIILDQNRLEELRAERSI